MFYVADGKVYIKEGNAYRNVGFTAKDKVITHRELESVTLVRGDVVVDSLNSPSLLTQDEIIRKFSLSEENPIPLMEEEKSAGGETADSSSVKKTTRQRRVVK